MLKNRKASTICSIVIIMVMLLAGCTAGKSVQKSKKTSYKPNSVFYRLKKPKVIQLGPLDCPWDKSYIIKNKKGYRSYGDSYAKKQNKKMEDAL